MNEYPRQPSLSPAGDSARAEAQQALLQQLPAAAFASECQRALDMIALCQQYLTCQAEAQSGPGAAALRQSLSDLAVTANRLARQVDTMTALLRCLQQTETPQWEPVELCGFVRTLCAGHETLRQALGLRLRADCGGLAQLTVQADRRYLSCICIQLLSNALRACTPGGGEIELRLCADGAGGALLCVADTGCGLPDAGPGASEANRARFLGTTKSGLLLCREYCRLAGWTLELRPRQKGPGTEALLHLPARGAAGGGPCPALRAAGTSVGRQHARRLWLDLVRELQCVPGLETTAFPLPDRLRES